MRHGLWSLREISPIRMYGGDQRSRGKLRWFLFYVYAVRQVFTVSDEGRGFSFPMPVRQLSFGVERIKIWWNGAVESRRCVIFYNHVLS
jgi:hypothetical protein